MVLIGADGGGTHTKLVLAGESGCVLASSEGGAVNYNAIGLAAARANLFDAAESMLVSVGQTIGTLRLLLYRVFRFRRARRCSAGCGILRKPF